MQKIKKSYEYIVIGSGFGGSPIAYKLAKAGKEVLVVERGQWVKRDDTCWDENILHLNSHPLYRGHTPFNVDQKKGKIQVEWPDDTVGGMSTLYGCAAFRMRAEDFLGSPMIDSAERNPDFKWPISYKDLEPYYEEMEKLQGVAGIAGEDISETPRKKDFPQTPPDVLSPPSARVWKAAKKMGLHPFHLPLAINFSGKNGKGKCILCPTCDHYMCKLEAKNDMSVTILPEAIEAGATLLADTRAIKINMKGNSVSSVDLVNQTSGERFTINCKYLIVSAGPMATPHLLLASGIDKIATGGNFIGHNLMRHINGVVSATFPFPTNRINMFQKQIGISDYYYGDPDHNLKNGPLGPWGLLQDISSIGKGVIKANSPFGLKNIAATASSFLINMLCIAEDMPVYDNRIFLGSNKDKFGSPTLQIYHRYTKRDIEVRKALYRKSQKILFKAGGVFFYKMPIETFSHALGTTRMGFSPENSVVDKNCLVWGTKNLYLSDAGVMPTGGSVNPSLTIGANALRVGSVLVKP